jgi:hypothetical protein
LGLPTAALEHCAWPHTEAEKAATGPLTGSLIAFSEISQTGIKPEGRGLEADSPD